MREMTSRRWRTLLAICFLGALMTASGVAGLTITDQGKSKYRIVVSASAIASERYAAEELQRYLEKMSGAKLPIITDTEPRGSHEILLGDNLHLARIRTKVDFAKLGPDGFRVRVDGNRLIIAGGKPRGTLNGVYTLLEEKLGVRWFTPELEVVPRVDRLRLAKLPAKQPAPLRRQRTQVKPAAQRWPGERGRAFVPSLKQLPPRRGP